MIDWKSMAFTAVWVTGIAILLAGWSYSRWSRQPTSRRVMWLGLILIISGLLALRVSA